MILLLLLSAVLAYVILYFVIKTAVKDAITETNRLNEPLRSKTATAYYTQNTFSSDDSEVPQIMCPKCGLQHDFDYPVCPGCGLHNYLK